MKKLLAISNMKGALLSFIFIFSFSFCEGQSWLWGQQGTSLSDDSPENSIAADSKGNVYMTGNYQNAISFGTYNLTSAARGMFLVKYNSKGNVLWATQPYTSGYGMYQGCTICTDDSDNVYVTGVFHDTAKFGNIILTSSPSSRESVFLVKYDSNGNVKWGKQSTGTMNSLAYTYGIATDDSANVFVTGYYMDTVAFGPLQLLGYQNVPKLLMVKFSSSGKERWAITNTTTVTGGPNSYSVSCDNQGNSYITGYFSDTIAIGPVTLIGGPGDMFLFKFDGNGNVLWGNQSMSQTPGDMVGQSVTNDTYGSSYITGYFSGTVTIGGHTIIAPSYPETSAYLAKYNKNGNFLWVRTSTSGWQGWGIASDKNNEIFLSVGTEYSAGSIVFCNATLNISAPNDPGVFLRVDTSGSAAFGSIIRTGGDDYDCITCSPDGNYVFVGGDIYDTITFGKDHLNNLATEPPFVARWGSIGAGVFQPNYLQDGIALFPNPNNGAFTIGIVGAQNFVPEILEIYNVLGEKVYSRFNIQNPTFKIDLNQPNGIYLYRIVAIDGSLMGEGKVIVQK